MMSLAIPFQMAKKMAANIEDSFLAKQPKVAFPVKRLAMDERAEGPGHSGPS